MLPLLKVHLALRLRCPLLVQIFARLELLQDEHLKQLLVHVLSMVLSPGHIDPDLESLFLAHLDAILHHRLQQQELSLRGAIALDLTPAVAFLFLLTLELAHELPLGEETLQPAVVIYLQRGNDLILDLLGLGFSQLWPLADLSHLMAARRQERLPT